MSVANDVDALPSPESAVLFTRTGDRIDVRPVTTSDRERVADFFNSVAPDDIRYRFLTTLKEVDAERIDAICQSAFPPVVSFLAFYGPKLVAIATLADAEDGVGEVALTTLPDWKGHGVSWTLLEHVVRFARDRGVREIISIENRENRAAIQLEHDMGFSIRLIDAGAGEIKAAKAI